MAVEILEQARLQFNAVGLVPNAIKNISSLAKSVDIVNAVADRTGDFKAAGLDGSLIASISIKAQSVDIVNAVADRIKDFKASGLGGRHGLGHCIASIAIKAQSLAQPKCLRKLVIC